MERQLYPPLRELSLFRRSPHQTGGHFFSPPFLSRRWPFTLTFQRNCYIYFGQQLGGNECGVSWGVVIVQHPIIVNFSSDASKPIVQPYFTIEYFIDCLTLWHKFTVDHTFSVIEHNGHCLDSQFAHSCLFRARRFLNVPLFDAFIRGNT